MGEGFTNGLHTTFGSPPLPPALPVHDIGGGIGGPLESLRQQLLRSGEALSRLVEPAGRTLIEGALRHLDEQVCRIAVVGQIKSGKSSFINALTQRPSLLPTDVTPWTTAVTNLHFRQSPPDDHAAIFQFFSSEEWQRLAEGDGRIRELTELLVPGFEADVLRAHFETLRRRAGARLGPEYDALLGKAHCFDTFDPAVLRHYVCSGDFAPEQPAGQIGKYSDITKQADLYCDGGPFEFPVTISDTPGTNDPFLIRDEITRQSLDSADLYIIVLTARQPLSEQDVTLLRLMRGLQKNRIAVFINRIDDFSDVRRDLAEVMSFVEKKLESEFPGTPIPIVAGSACWANAALNLDDRILDRLFERRGLSYIAQAGVLGPHELERSAMNDPATRERMRQSLYFSSGMPEMYRVIAGLMESSNAIIATAQIARSFGEIARASEATTRNELDRLKELATDRAAEPVLRQQHLEQLGREAHELNAAAANIEESGKSIEIQLAGIIEEEMNELRRALTVAVESHAAVEREVLIDTLKRGRAPRVWTHEGIELRRRLSRIFMTRFQNAASRILDFRAKIAPELNRVLNIIAPNAAIPREPEFGLPEIPIPTISPLSRFIALDLDVSRWSTFWRRKPAAAASGEQFEALIKVEFEPVVEDLVKSAHYALSDYCMTTTRWSFGICINILQALERRRAQLVQAYHALQNDPDGTRALDMGHEEVAEIERLADRVDYCRTVAIELESIVHELNRGFQRASGYAS